MGQGAVKVKGASCRSSSPVQALFGDVMGQQWFPESSLSEVTDFCKQGVECSCFEPCCVT